MLKLRSLCLALIISSVCGCGVSHTQIALSPDPSAVGVLGGPSNVNPTDMLCLDSTAMDNPEIASIEALAIQPATPVQGRYLINSGKVMLIADGLQHVETVFFCIKLVGTDARLVGEGKIQGTEAIYEWQPPSDFSNGLVWVIAVGKNGQVVRSHSITAATSNALTSTPK